MLLNILQGTEPTPMRKNHLAENVNSAEVEKLWSFHIFYIISSLSLCMAQSEKKMHVFICYCSDDSRLWKILLGSYCISILSFFLNNNSHHS